MPLDQAEKFLPFCAICCLGSIHCVYDLYSKNKDQKPRILYLEILKDYCLESTPKTACFTTLIKSYLDQRKVVLDANDLKYLVKKFKEKCLKQI